MDFSSYIPHMVVLRTFLRYTCTIASGHLWIPPVRSTLFRISLDNSLRWRDTRTILCSYSHHRLTHRMVDHMPSFLRLLMRPLDLYIRRTFSAPALQSFAHRLKSKFPFTYAYLLWFTYQVLVALFVRLTGTCLCNIVVRSQTEDSLCAAYSRVPSLPGSEFIRL